MTRTDGFGVRKSIEMDRVEMYVEVIEVGIARVEVGEFAKGLVSGDHSNKPISDRA